MEEASDKKESETQNEAAVYVRFYHPKLVDKRVNIIIFESLMDLRPILAESSLLYLFENYHFQQKSKRLSQVQPLMQILNPQLQVDVILHAYDERTSKSHFGKIVDIISNPEIYVYTLRGQKQDQQGQPFQNNDTESRQMSEHFTKMNLSFENINYSLDNELLEPKNSKALQVQLVHFICLSGFNPPPSNQRLNGDLFYIHCRTLECQDVHITATPQGYFVNQSKISNFNPQIVSNNKTIYVSLIDLLRSISQKFKNNLSSYAQEKRLSDSEIYRISLQQKGTCYNKWLQTCDYQHSWNSRKSLKSDYFRMESVGIKDWNQMFQMNSQIPTEQGSMIQIQKIKNFITIYTEFEMAAIEGSKNLVDGKIPPLNPMDDTKKHIYIYNNIFFSIANETPFDHSQEKGQEATPSSSAINADIINLEILQNLQIPELHVLHMIVVCYRGYKVIAQCIIPGILTGDQSNCSQYGSIDDGKTVQTNPQFEKLMVQICNKLHLKPNVSVKDGKGQIKTIAGSPDIKGILGSDKRKYILDLLRLSPRDLNYDGLQNEVCVVRSELMSAFKAKKTANKTQMPFINTNIGTQIDFVPDQHIEKEKQLLKEIASYIIENAIPELINGLKSSLSSSLTDSKGISYAFHKHGVNLRYLGRVCNHESLKEHIDIRVCLQRVILAKSLKHLFKLVMRETNILYLNQVLAHLFNSLFGKRCHLISLEERGLNAQQSSFADLKEGKKKKKKKTKEQEKADQEAGQNHVITSISPIKVPYPEYLSMKPSQLWQIVRKVADKRYYYSLPENLLEFNLLKIPYQKIAALRDLCLMVGLVLQKKQYNILEQIKSESEKVLPFTVKNIAALNAIPKKRKLKPDFIETLIKNADSNFERYSMPQALQDYNQANRWLLIIGGPLTDEIAYIRSKIGRIFYVMGSHPEAIESELTALNIIEAVSTHDSAKAIQSYSTLGLYYSVKGEKNKAFYYLFKSIYLMLISFGETYPDFLINIVNLARIYHQSTQYSKVADVYLNAIAILKKINGKEHFKVSFLYSSLATLYYEIADYKKAIEYQAEAVSILTKILPENDNRLGDATKILKRYQQVNINNNKNYANQMAPRPTFEMNPPKKEEESEKKQVNKSKKGKK